MLIPILGRAGSGKTTWILDKVEHGKTGRQSAAYCAGTVFFRDGKSSLCPL